MRLDPEFWQARGELAYAYIWRAMYTHHVPNMVNAAEQAAITLAGEPDNGPALLVSAALSSIVDYDQAKAESTYRRLFASPPADQSFLRFNYSRLYPGPRGDYQ